MNVNSATDEAFTWGVMRSAWTIPGDARIAMTQNNVKETSFDKTALRFGRG